MIKELKSPQVTAALTAVHLPVRRIQRDAVWGSIDAPEGVDVGNLLYRFYDGEGLPLYVGKTTTGTARLEQHRRGAEWYGLVEFVALSLYPNHELVLRAERAAIRSEQPRFNRADRRGRKRVELHLHGPAEEAAAVLLDEAEPEFLAELVRILGIPSRSLLAVAPPAPEWGEDSYDLTPEEQAEVDAALAVMDEQLRWAQDIADHWRTDLGEHGHRKPTVDEYQTFHGALCAADRSEEHSRARLRGTAMAMAQWGRYDLDEALAMFAPS